MESATSEAVIMTDVKLKTKFLGKVVKTTLAGALIDIGASHYGLLHISQLLAPADQPIKSVKDVLKEGDEIEVWVRRVKDDRIELTMIKPLDLEWRDIKQDMVVTGKVVRMEAFGVFLDIGAERPGLIHISELAHGYVKTPADVVQEGQELEAQVIDVNKKKKQIKLSLKSIQPEPVHEETEKASEPKRERRRKKPASQSRGEKNIEQFDVVAAFNAEVHSADAAPTAMEMAFRQAQERAGVRKQEVRAKKIKAADAVQTEILSRTLENKIDTSK